MVADPIMYAEPEDDPRKFGFYSAKNPPPDVAAAERRVLQLACAIAEIDVQLAHDVFLRGGVPLPDDEYAEWRGKALRARSYAERERAFLDLWLAEQRVIEEEVTDDFGPAVRLLCQYVRHAYDAGRAIPSDVCDALTTTERALGIAPAAALRADAW